MKYFESYRSKFSKCELLGMLKIITCSSFCAVLIFISQDRIGLQSLFARKEGSVVEVPALKISSIDLAQAIQLHFNPKVVFLDVRAKGFYDYGHISRAQNFDPNANIDFSEQQLSQWKEASAIVVYCNGVSCGIGYSVAKQLINHGLTNVKVYANGWPEWRSCRLPIDMSDEMKKDVADEMGRRKQKS